MSLQIWLPLNGSLENKGLNQRVEIEITHSSPNEGYPTVEELNATDNGKVTNASYKWTSHGQAVALKNYMNTFKTYNNYSIAAWYKYNQLSGFQHSTVICSSGNWNIGNGQLCFGLSVTNENKYTAVLIPNTGNWNTTISFGRDFEHDQWYHICLTKCDTGTYLYINGEEIGKYSGGGITANSESQDLYIGAATYFPGFTSINSQINDFRIYNHALSDTEVKLLAQGLVAHYPLKAPFLPNLLQGAEQYTKESPLVRNVADVSQSNWQDSYVYHTNITANIKRPGRYLFVLNADGTPRDHVKDADNTTENRKYMICLRGPGGHPVWEEFQIEKDGRHYGFLDITTAGVYDLRTNLYLYNNQGSNYTVKFWDMQLFECDQYIPEIFEPPGLNKMPGDIRTRLGLDKCFAQDTSGYAHHTEQVGTIITGGHCQKYSNCGYFDGLSYLESNCSTFGLNDLTLSAWVYPHVNGPTNDTISNDRSCIVIGGAYITIAPAGDGKAKVHTYFYGKNKPGYHPSTSTINIGEWSHIVATWDDISKKHCIYINGVCDTIIEECYGPADWNASADYEWHYKKYIGREVWWHSSGHEVRDFNGLISDVRIYSTALSGNDVLSLYNNTINSNDTLASAELIESNFVLKKDAYSANIGGNFTELNAPISNMKIKTLPDRTAWARIHSLDLTEQKSVFQDNEKVENCDVFGKYSKMSLVEEFKKNSLSNYEFMLTYPTLQTTLPSEYVQLEYVESNGNQYVDTNIMGGARWELDVQFNVNGSRQLMGYGGSSNEYWGIVEDGNYGLAKGASWGSIVVPNIYAGKRDVVVHSYNDQGRYYLRAQDAQITLGASVDVTSKKYMLFALNSSLSGKCYAKLYGCNCIQNGQLIRKFVPALRSSDNVAGLYDLVNKQFYTSGSGTHLLAGPKIETYTRLEYIESNPGSYINTSFTPNQDTRVECAFSMSSVADNQSYIYGTANGEWNQKAFELYPWSGKYQFNFGDTASGNNWVGNTLANQRIISTQDKSGVTINGEHLGLSNNTTFTAVGPLYLFALNRNNGSIATPVGKTKMYSCRIYDNGTLIREYVPIITSSGQIGMLDIVHNLFYPSLGVEFTAGPKYGNEYFELEYIESTGTQYINTGVVPSETLETEILFTPTGGLREHAIFGSSWAANGYFLMFYHNQIRWHSGGKWIDIGSYSAGDKVVCHCANKYIIVNGATYSINGGENTTDTIKILDNMGYTNEGSGKGIGKIEYIRMWENGKLIRDFIPVQKTDGVVCLYDKQNKQYYTNAGTEAFRSGPRVDLLTSLPIIEQYNRWIQTNSPNMGYRQSTGYQPIHTDFCRWNGSKYSSGPITKSFDQEHSAYLVSESNDPWAPIGQKELYGTGIRALNNTTQHQVELWVRVDKMPEATEVKTNDGCVIAPQFIEY